MKPANTNPDTNPTEASDSVECLPQTVPTTAEAAVTAHANSAPTTVPGPASNDILDMIKRDRAESLKRKQRSDSFLHRLDRDQLTKVIEWLGEEEDIGIVYQNITAPAPEGLGLEVGLSTIRRLRAHVTATLANTRATEILDTIIDMESPGNPTHSASSGQSERIQSAINQLLHQKAFELVRTAPGAPELFELLAAIERLSALDLKRQKIALDREKMLRRDQRATVLPFTREHHVKLEIVPTPRSVHNSHPSHASHNSPQSDQSQPVEIIAPLPEVIL